MAEHRYPERTVVPPRASLRPHVEAGCRLFNLIPVVDSQQAAVDGAAEIRALLRSEPR